MTLRKQAVTTIYWLAGPIVAALNGLSRLRRTAEARGLERRIVRKASTCGPGLSVKGPGSFTGLNSLELGENVHIGKDAFFRCEGGLRIGDNTHVSRRVTVYTMNHEYEGDLLPYDSQVRHRAVRIGRNVWIGMNVTILPGAVIPDGCIIGAGSTVGGSLEPRAIYAAPRAIRIGSRDADHYAERDRNRLYGGSNGIPYSGDTEDDEEWSYSLARDAT